MNGYYRLVDREAVQVKDIHEAWQEASERRVDQTIKDGVEVSTVFLTTDHALSSDSPPVLFETMVFGGEFDNECDRYHTYEEAEAGHVAMCKRVFG